MFKSLFISSFVFLLAHLSWAEEALPGKQVYEINCMACHQLDTFVVGPALIEIAQMYPADRVEYFIEWCNNPGRKDARATVPMPVMSYLGDEKLAQVHEYLLKVTKGKRMAKQAKPKWPPFKNQKPTFPYVKRAFLPKATAAAIGVMLSDGLALCWDAGVCRFRYAWNGDGRLLALDSRAYKMPDKKASLEAQIFYEETSTLWPEEYGTERRFYGYRIVARFPEFHYQVGALEVKELLGYADNKKGWSRSFQVEGLTGGLQLNFGQAKEVKLFCDVGRFEEGVLYLSQDEATAFTVKAVKQ